MCQADLLPCSYGTVKPFQDEHASGAQAAASIWAESQDLSHVQSLYYTALLGSGRLGGQRSGAPFGQNLAVSSVWYDYWSEVGMNWLS